VDAGQKLAKVLRDHGLQRESPIVLALPRGGVPVAWEARAAPRCARAAAALSLSFTLSLARAHTPAAALCSLRCLTRCHLTL